MNARNRTIVSVTMTLLTGLSAYAGIAQAVEHAAATITSTSSGFLTPSARRAPGPYSDSAAGLVDALCAVAKRSARLNCPPTAAGGPASGNDTITTGPHLRLNIILREIRNVVIAGSGLSGSQPDYSGWIGTAKITSSMADVSQPTILQSGYSLQLPGAGDTWTAMNDANKIFRGIILNGCTGAAATFDLTLYGSIADFFANPPNPLPAGEIHATDAVQGHNNYNFQYKIRATDSNGNQSDFIFSGDADSFCTANSALP